MPTPPTILIADDDHALVQALKIRLEQEGYEVVAATDGYSALARAVEREPDLLVLDIHMPAGSGFSVQERKANNTALADVPVIYITGDHSLEAQEAATASNAVGLIHKPLDIETLLALIAQTLPCETT